MNFFKSILSDDPDSPKSEDSHGSDPNSPLKLARDGPDSNVAAGADPADGWSFGGLIKTLAIDSVIETYRRDLKEFGSGLKKESEMLRETASRAVKDLPASIEASASAAHGALDGVLKSTAVIISKESLFASDGEPETPGTNRSLNSGRYSWFEAQLSAIQSDSTTFCEDPEDLEEYKKWKLGFELEKNEDEIDSLIGENGVLEGAYKSFVPGTVDPEAFWSRYFYRVDKLKQQESVRANLVKRAISVDDEEELSWDFDDDDEDGNGNVSVGNVKKGDAVGDNVSSDKNTKPVEKQEGSNSESRVDNNGGDVSVDDNEKSNLVKSKGIVDDGEESNLVESKNTVDASLGEKEVKSKEGNFSVDDSEKNKSKSSMDASSGEKEAKSEIVAEEKIDEKVKSEESINDKNDEKASVREIAESLNKSDSPVGSNHQAKADDDEEDLGWDEIEDIGSGDEKKISSTTQSGSPNRADLRKRLSVAEDDDDDLSWDIEEDDEPVKA